MCATTATGRGDSSRVERRREARAARRAASRAPKSAHAAVRRQRAVDGAVGEHDDLVDARRERAHLRHGRAEHRVLRVDLLGDEDEPAHHQKKSRSPSSKCGCRGSGAPSTSDLPSSVIVRGVGTIAGERVAPALRSGGGARRSARSRSARAAAASPASERRRADHGHDADAPAPPDDRVARVARLEQRVVARRVGEAPVQPGGVAQHAVAGRPPLSRLVTSKRSNRPRTRRRARVRRAQPQRPRPHPQRAAAPASRAGTKTGAEAGVRDRQQRAARPSRATRSSFARLELREDPAARGTLGSVATRTGIARPRPPRRRSHRAGS